METVSTIEKFLSESKSWKWKHFLPTPLNNFNSLWQIQVPTKLPESHYPEGQISIGVKLWDTSGYKGCPYKVAIVIELTGQPHARPESVRSTLEISISAQEFRSKLEPSMKALVRAWEALYEDENL